MKPQKLFFWTGADTDQTIEILKDIPADRMGPRMRYKEAIEQILSEPYSFDEVKPCVESKVFGVGVEALYDRLCRIYTELCGRTQESVYSPHG